MLEWNVKYANYLATECTNCVIESAAVSKAEATGGDAVLALVNDDFGSFGSAAWFLRTQCSAEICEGLGTGSQEGWEAFLTSCVGVEATEDRTEIWRKAIAKGRW